MTNDFSSLNLHAQLLQAVTELGYVAPTPIQESVIPLMLAGEDVLGQAQTGTGKTAAFALPILQDLDPNLSGVQSLVLAPTRELAMQVAKAIYSYGQFYKVKVLAVYGGQPYRRQVRRLQKGIHIVVGTPGRLLDLINRGDLDLSAVQTVVLDEADEMLSMGFIEDIEAILEKTPEERQTALFSATLPTPIRQLANRYMNNPQSVTIKRKHLTVDATEQSYYLVKERDKLAALTRLFEVEDITSSIIFVRTRLGCGRLANDLVLRGFQAEALNGDLSQEAREQVTDRFRKGKIKVLVATDVAARGLDIDNISHVFNYDLPLDVEVYVHRIGRTGRAGNSGTAISLISPSETRFLHKIERYIKHQIPRATLPTIEEIQEHREKVLLDRLMVWIERDRARRERVIVADLIEAGHDPILVAAAALKLARAEEKQRPILAIGKVSEPRERFKGIRNESQKHGYPERDRRKRKRTSHAGKYSHEEGMVRMVLPKGRTHGVSPRDVVGTIAYHAGIPGSTIGKIHIREQETFVDIPEEFVSKVLAKAGSYQIHQENITIDRA